MLQRSVSTMGVAEREKMREYTKERAKGGSMLEGGKKGGMMEGGKKGGSMMEALDWNSDEGDFNMEEVFLALEDLGHKKTGCRTLLLYLCFVLVFYAVLYFQINPADVFAVQDAIKASVGGIEWSHGNSYKVRAHRGSAKVEEEGGGRIMGCQVGWVAGRGARVSGPCGNSPPSGNGTLETGAGYTVRETGGREGREEGAEWNGTRVEWVVEILRASGAGPARRTL